MSTDTKETKETNKACPYSFSNLFGYGNRDDDGKDTKKVSSRRFPWRALLGLSLVALIALSVTYVSVAVIIGYYYYLWVLFKIPFKIAFAIASLVFNVIFWPISFLLSCFRYPGLLNTTTSTGLACTNAMELQGWEVLTLLPGSDGNPATVKYTLNSPTPHSISIVDIDYRDTRIDILSNGKYYGTTSDFVLNKTEFCGEDLNKCIAQGFSTGTVIIPGGIQNVEVTWSGKDVFPGTDKIVWGGERRRRVMWKKDLCL